MNRSRELLLSPPPPDIGETDGFETSDIFEAKAVGEGLANILGDLADHAVIVLDGPWGSGKSVFARQWAGLLRHRGHTVVYFDAFEHDHLDDAFFPLFGHLLEASNSDGPRREEAKATLIRTVTPLIKAMPRIVADAALRVGTGGLLSFPDVRRHVGDATCAKTDDIEAFIEESLDQAATQVAAVQGFRNALTTAFSKTGDSGQAKAPLVFVIDELDRCRPSYALNVLERIKHLFAVDGICFVLVTHLEALAAMVERAYGVDEADRYLDKFFQLRFDIRRLLGRGAEPSHKRYLQHLAECMGFPWDSNQFTTATINRLVQVYDLTFRSQERIMLNLALFYRAREGPTRLRWRTDEGGSLALAAGLCVMRDLEPSLYRDAARGRMRYENAVAFLRFEQWTGLSEEAIDRVRSFWQAAAVDGQAHSTEAEMGDLPVRRAEHWRRRLAEICAEIDQLWQQ